MSSYQKLLDKITHIILIYSAIAIFLVPLVRTRHCLKLGTHFSQPS